jgi:hypothetical protein
MDRLALRNHHVVTYFCHQSAPACAVRPIDDGAQLPLLKNYKSTLNVAIGDRELYLNLLPIYPHTWYRPSLILSSPLKPQTLL